MASTVYFLFISGFIFAITQSVTSGISNEWGVEKSSVNPLAVTDEARYSRVWTTERPVTRRSMREDSCPVDEHFTRCGANCQITCDNLNKPIMCQKICLRGCVCNYGLVRGPGKKCIKPEFCPTQLNTEAQHRWCEEYEVWEFRYAHCPRNCSNFDDVLLCRKIYVAGCVCDYPNGYVRAPNGKCVTIEKCPNKYTRNLLTDVKFEQSKEDEIPPNLEKGNPPLTKSNFWPPIPPISIPLICGKNELFYSCSMSCPDDCNNFRNQDRKCKGTCIISVPSCVCKNGLVRSPDGKCIKSYDCPKEKNFCPSGEEYSPCTSYCEGDCVKGEDNRKYCIRARPLCVPGCVCKAGLVRGPEGTCIHSSECPTTPPEDLPTKVCPENEQYDPCKAACQRNCSNVDLALPCPDICFMGCVCKGSMIRGKYGKCVEENECPKIDSHPDSYVTLNPPPYTDDDYHIPESVTTISPIWEESTRDCPPRQIWVVCGGHCGRTCSNKDDEVVDCKPVCIPGCICKEGFVMGPGNECIEKEKCPSKSDSEINSYVTLNPPPYTDDDYHIPESVRTISKISQTEDSKFEDIPPISRSKPTHDCPPRQIWVVCGGHCGRTCRNKDDEVVDCKPVCIPGCICEEGFVMGPGNECIEKEKCPSKSDSERNSYVTLNPPPYTDDDYHIPEPLKTISPISQSEDSKFEDIPPISRSSHLRLICGKDEYLDPCPSSCPDNCTNYKDTARKCSKICFPKCICKKGLVRGPNGKCIKTSHCLDDITSTGFFTINKIPKSAL